MIHRSPLPDVEIPDVTLPGYVLHRARELGDKPALIDGPTGRVLTYAQLDQGVRSLAGGLAVILGVIGVKLVLHWAHGVWPAVPTIPTLAGLVVIVAVLATVTVTSLRATARRDRDAAEVTAGAAH